MEEEEEIEMVSKAMYEYQRDRLESEIARLRKESYKVPGIIIEERNLEYRKGFQLGLTTGMFLCPAIVCTAFVACSYLIR